MHCEIYIHDVNIANGLGVSKLWNELKEDNETEEFIADGSKMGIGKVRPAGPLATHGTRFTA